MQAESRSLFGSLGFLRLGLLGLALLNMLLPLIDTLFTPVNVASGERSLWEIMVTLIAPVLAPLLVVVILFEYIMSRVRAADAEGALRARYLAISRIELLVIGVTLVFWVPFFFNLMR